MKITLQELKRIIHEAIDDDREDFNDAVDELMKQPEMKSVEAFVEAKYDDDEETYGTLELQALARNLYLKDQHGKGVVHKHELASAPAAYRDKVKTELASYGLRFVPREKVKQHRGFTAPFHGTSGLKDMHGGSGFDNRFNTPKGPGTVWTAGDKSVLGMGAKRRMKEARRDDQLRYFVVATQDEHGKMYLARSVKDEDAYDEREKDQPVGQHWTLDKRRARVYSTEEGARAAVVRHRRDGTRAFIERLM